MNNSSCANKPLKPKHPHGAHLTRFLVGGLHYKLASIQSDKCHSVDFDLINPNL